MSPGVTPEPPGAASKGTPLVVLAALALLPAAESLVAVWLEILPCLVFPLAKAAMIAAPLLTWRAAGLTRSGLLEEAGLAGARRRPGPAGVVSGLVVSGVILAAWYGVLRGEVDLEAVRTKAESLDIVRWYWLFAVYLCLANALLEEYYFRAFLLGRTRPLLGSGHAAAAVNGGLFGVHHVFVLGSMIDSPAVVAVLVLGTVLGGYHWSMMRVRGFSIVDCCISHAMADAAIMWAG